MTTSKRIRLKFLANTVSGGSSAASDGNFLRYVAANDSVEYSAVTVATGDSVNLVEGNLDSFASYANSTFASDADLNITQGNLTTFASYANTTFSGGSGTVQGNLETFATYANSTFKANTANVSYVSHRAGHTDVYNSINVRVFSKTQEHYYYNSGSGNGYLLDEIESPWLTLSPGVYRFEQNISTNSGHPLRFYLDPDKNTQYTQGVTAVGTPGSAGAYTQISITPDTPKTLYYQCTAHEKMGFGATILGNTANVDVIQGNLDSFASYANSTFGSGGGGGAVKIENSAGVIDGAIANIIFGAGLVAVATGTSNTVTVTTDDSFTYKYSHDLITANGSTNVFSTSRSVDSANNIFVTFDGLLQSPNDDYNISASELTLNNTSPIVNGTEIEVRYVLKATSTSNLVADSFTADGSTNTFTLSESAAVNSIFVSVAGIIQSPTTHYVVDATSLTLNNTNPIANGTLVSVRHMPAAS